MVKKISPPPTIVILARYGSHKFSSKFPKFVENLIICKFFGLPFFPCYAEKNEFQLYFVLIQPVARPPTGQYMTIFAF